MPATRSQTKGKSRRTSSRNANKKPVKPTTSTTGTSTRTSTRKAKGTSGNKKTSTRKVKRNQSPKQSPKELIISTEKKILNELSNSEKQKMSDETNTIAQDITKKHGTIDTAKKLQQTVHSTLNKLQNAARSKKKYQVAKFSLALMALFATAFTSAILERKIIDDYDKKYREKHRQFAIEARKRINELMAEQQIEAERQRKTKENMAVYTILKRLLKFIENITSLQPVEPVAQQAIKSTKKGLLW